MGKLLLSLAILGGLTTCSPKWAPDHYWSQKRWVLTEMKGVPVQQSGTRRDAYLEFAWADKRFSGNGGCNSINGKYTLENKKNIHFTEVISTKMSCPDISFENTFLSILNSVDRFDMEGNIMQLKDGKKTVLAFEGREQRVDKR
jgi:heat shock protein HslJ